MKKMIFGLLSLLLLTTGMKAQVAIGTKAAEVESSAVLDLNSGIDGNLGLLLPRVPLTAIDDDETIPDPATGLLVYADGTGGLAAGVYAWDGSIWQTNGSSARKAYDCSSIPEYFSNDWPHVGIKWTGSDFSAEGSVNNIRAGGNAGSHIESVWNFVTGAWEPHSYSPSGTFPSGWAVMCVRK